MDTFTEIPSYTSDATVADRLNIGKFGDGYEQRTLDGINTRTLKFTVIFDKVTTAKCTRVTNFLQAKGALTPFLWTPPPPYAGGPLQVVARLPLHPHLQRIR